MKYYTEIVNMNTEILEYIIHLRKTVVTPYSENNEQSEVEVQESDIEHRVIGEDEVECNILEESKVVVREEMFDYIFEQLNFVKKRFYFFFSKTFIVLAYLIITIETFLRNRSSLTLASFKDVVELLLVLIGPYFFFINICESRR
jgi:hypothetical protein